MRGFVLGLVLLGGCAGSPEAYRALEATKAFVTAACHEDTRKLVEMSCPAGVEAPSCVKAREALALCPAAVEGYNTLADVYEAVP